MPMPVGVRVALVVAASAAVGALAGWLLARRFGPRVAAGLGLAGLGLFGVLIVLARAAQGMEGLAQAILAVLFVFPAAVGALAVAAAMAWRRR